MNKRAQSSGSTAATLIGIITILLIFYILFLPPSAREELLSDRIPAEPADTAQAMTILKASIGKLAYVGENEFEHYLPNLYLYESRSAELLTSISPFKITKTIYKTDKKEHTFLIADPANTQNTFLSITTPKYEGILRIKFNEMDIFEGVIRQTNPPPILIDTKYLKEKNTITFSLEGFGMPSREYEFSEAKIIGDVRDTSRLSGKSSIPIGQAEYSSIGRAWIDFYAACNQLDVGILEITLNDRKIFTGVPNCESLNRKDLYREDLKPGKNDIDIKISSGSASIEQIKIKTILDPTKSFADYFNIHSDIYAQILNRNKNIKLSIKFVDDKRLKNAKLNINGRLYMIDQKTPEYKIDITSEIEEGNNYIELTPLTELNIMKLEITAE